VVAFRRRYSNHAVAVMVPRLTASLGCPPLGLAWEDTAVALPKSRAPWRDVLTGEIWTRDEPLAMAEAFRELPLAVVTTEQVAE
jgi:(1->4)-alpha-D-glucan 1-alpha-D-glucosylmutase